MAARRPFWKWHRWKSIGFCLWPPSTCIWNLKLKFQSKLDLCSGNHVVYRQTDRRTDKVNPVYPPPTSLGGLIIKMSSYQYRKSHCGDKTAVRSSYLHNGISYIGKITSLYWIMALGPFHYQHCNWRQNSNWWKHCCTVNAFLTIVLLQVFAHALLFFLLLLFTENINVLWCANM